MSIVAINNQKASKDWDNLEPPIISIPACRRIMMGDCYKLVAQEGL